MPGEVWGETRAALTAVVVAEPDDEHIQQEAQSLFEIADTAYLGPVARTTRAIFQRFRKG